MKIKSNYDDSTLEVINTGNIELYGMMHSAAQPWAVIRCNAEGLIMRCIARYATKGGAVRCLRRMDRKPGQG